MVFRRRDFEPRRYDKGQRLKAKTVNELIQSAEETSAFTTPGGMSGPLGQLARLVSRMLIRRVEMVDDLDQESSAAARLVEWQGETDRYKADAGTEFKVHDGLGGDESTGCEAVDGQRGYAIYMADRGEWEMLGAQGGGGSLSVVTVEKDGGDNGDASTTCSVTYEVKSLSGTTLASRVTPEQGRYTDTTYLPAGEGGRSAYAIAAYVGTGASTGLILLSVPGEIADNTAC